MPYKYFVRIQDQILSPNELNQLYVKEVATLLNLSSGEVRIEKDADGMPFGFAQEKKMFLSFSHSDNIVAGCVSQSCPVGIDVQKIRPVDLKVLNKICTKNELTQLDLNTENFFRIWTIKEAALKCTGLGFQYGAKKLEINFEAQTVLATEGVEKLNWKKNTLLRFEELSAPQGYKLVVVFRLSAQAD